jgi:hypothetical protein
MEKLKGRIKSIIIREGNNFDLNVNSENEKQFDTMLNDIMSEIKCYTPEKPELADLIANEIYSMLDNHVDVEIPELAYKMYNEDYYIIGTYQAAEFCKTYFHEMLDTLEDYQEEFGEAYKNIQNSENVASLIALKTCEKILNNCDTIQKNWDNELNEDMIKEIKEELKESYDIEE